MRFLLRSAAITALPLLAACQSALEPETEAAKPVISKPQSPDAIQFIVMGDTPYSPADSEMLKQAVPLINQGDYPFIIHVGDYKGGGAECLESHDAAQEILVKSLHPPVFYTPGDNEWTDCDRHKLPGSDQYYSDLSRLETIRTKFFGKHAPTEFSAVHQDSLIENARWSYKDVVFITLHVLGTNNGRDWVVGDTLEAAASAAAARDGANHEWLIAAFAEAKKNAAKAVVIALHADMTDIEDKPADVMCENVSAKENDCDGFTQLRAAIQAHAITFEKPVILIHGDTSPFTLNHEFSGEDAPNLWRLNAAGDAGEKLGHNWGTRDVTHVSLQPGSDIPLAVRGLITGKIPKKK